MGEKKITSGITEGFLSLDEASAFLGHMPKETIKQKVGQGIIPAYKPGKNLMFCPKELREFVKKFRK